MPGVELHAEVLDQCSGVRDFLNPARDQIVTAMAARVRRIVYARCLGRTQREIAEAEGITQSAVSQQLTTSGAAAIVAGYALLRDGG